MPLNVFSVDTDSPASKAGIHIGDRILDINGNPVNDFLDLRFESAEPGLVIRLRQPDGTERSVRIRKRFDEPLGIEPEPHRCRTCANKCLFCFVDQVPPNARPTLRVKDDDPAYSFLYGNFITLTNMTDHDFNRIYAQRRSPLYVSVHSTDPVRHRTLIGYRHAFDLMARLRELNEHGIDLHTQIVVVPGINDGAALEHTLSDLAALQNVLTVGIVPVGVTRYRDHLPELKLVNAAVAGECLRIAGYFNGLRCEPWVFGADELYLKAGIDVPDDEYYGDYAQIENGIGMLRRTRENWQENREAFSRFAKSLSARLHLVTGVSAYSLISGIAADLNTDLGAGTARATAVVNHWLGETVTVTGLLNARDILAQVVPESDEIVIVASSLFNGDGVTLDDMPAEELRECLGGRLIVVDELFTEWELVEAR
jgi:putative radical SAM enzyme (TIGR03279 family)